MCSQSCSLSHTQEVYREHLCVEPRSSEGGQVCGAKVNNLAGEETVTELQEEMPTIQGGLETRTEPWDMRPSECSAST